MSEEQRVTLLGLGTDRTDRVETLGPVFSTSGFVRYSTEETLVYRRGPGESVLGLYPSTPAETPRR